MKSRLYPNDAVRWKATATRDLAAANDFVYAVKTTGIFCRPTCSSRLARRSNVTFFDTSTDALAAGYRACKRCKRRKARYEPARDLVDSVCARLECGREMTLAEMATGAGSSRWHSSRMSKKVMGITPRVWVLLNPLGKKYREDSGLNSALGALPEDGIELDVAPASEVVQYTTIQAAHEVLLVAFQKGRISKLDLAASELETLFELEMAFPFPQYVTIVLLEDGSDRDLQAMAEQAAEALDRPSRRTLSPFMSDDVFTHFKMSSIRVYTLLQQIPSGRVSSYAAMAAALGSSPRAVGGALRRNLGVTEVPCHRCRAANGHISGFKSDWEKAPSGQNQTSKLALLREEGVEFDDEGYLVDREAWFGKFVV
ncbi:hypothetical protein LTR62_005937 [Meristemomyces frigidus]|uniref:Methylated-DNA--protein-cysteine methyltransferase n=1 Tax=Meristemomyces frigidus TaxID=1508187 RepID=A0AAN7YJ81_9PEZI|nr:hypothetical protein LTR62_005937 [Meristemomyces frigidus]